MAERALAAELCAAAETAGYKARGVRHPEDAPDVAKRWEADAVVFDAALAGHAAVTQVRRVRAVHECACVLLLPDPSAEFLTLVSQCNPDAVMLRTLDGPVLAKVLNRRRGPGASTGPAQVHDLPVVVAGASPEMREVWRLAMVAARTESSSVVITGETGVGKEVVARGVHRLSIRCNGPFVAVNCAALPDNLLESELFGHEKGAFTGATAQRKGRFELANGGTLFLDEIGDLPLALQVKLLRVLQERAFERVGGSRTLHVDVRIIAATHRDLLGAIEKGDFRADLFYRLNVLRIHIPPLRERKADILALWEQFLEQSASREGCSTLPTHSEAQRLLLKYDWPGNVRELNNAVLHALAVCEQDCITPEDLPPSIAKQQAKPVRDQHNLLGMSLKEVERAAILETYEALGSVKETAKLLEISERKIHYRLKEYRREHTMEEPSMERSLHQGKSASKDETRVVLAEDDDDLRGVLSAFLQAEGYEVVAVPDGRALLEHLGSAMLLEHRDVPPDIIISDLRMPGLTGMQLLESVRGRGWSTPVVLMSAFGDEHIRDQARALGAAAFLDKPFDEHALRDVIQNIGPRQIAVFGNNPRSL